MVYYIRVRSSAGTKSVSRARDPWSCSPCWRPSRDAHGWRTSYSSTTKRTRKSPTATLHGQLSSPCSSGRRFANFQRQRAPAGPPNSGFRADTPRFRYYCAHMCSLSQSGGLVVVFGVSAGRAGPG
eukprot:scaffold7905_cov62-Phaeocystis_antarctica.AAC.4